ncbi:SUMF1/EgtB/PvdO family nonheme iron enzyme [Schlesneria paludicola]|uniref:SUMF1/EgtB/PvdO family nonheme iron enzyme n=1 Tax=Schlesneria paludicola TaxID=360056 RepID=UPI00031833EE|nr:SUMF1/EgtB/PvdO family nonheme iron enzyme [Schlesneria paludicola]
MKIAGARLISLLICSAFEVLVLAEYSRTMADDGSLAGNYAGQVRADNGLSMTLVWCPPGGLMMEQVEVPQEPSESEPNAEQNRRAIKVSLNHGFWMGRYEVTQAEWDRVMKTRPWNDCRHFVPDQDDSAATCINWFDAAEFCCNLSREERAAGRLPEGWEYTLPTEAQWEYACRAGTKTRFDFGDDDSLIGESAWFFENTSGKRERYAHRVGQKRPNAWGLFDMHGNASEWCRDFYQQKLPGGVDPYVADEGWNRAIRGGCFNDLPDACRSAHRDRLSPIPRGNCIGFRIALCPGDADSTVATLQKLKQTIPILVETERSGPALEPAARKAGAFPGDEPDVVQALIKIKNLRGSVRRDFGKVDAPILSVDLAFSNHLRDDDLELLRPLNSVREVNLAHTSVHGDCIEQIAGLPGVLSLNLGGTKISNAAMRDIRMLPDIQELCLYDTAVSDEGVAHLSELKALRRLFLNATPITDAALKSLARMDSLTDLNLEGTRVSPAALDELIAARPNLTITSPIPVVNRDTVPSPLVGKISMNWTAVDLAGQKHSLEEYRGKVVILDFWFRQCSWCLKAMPQVNEVGLHFMNQPVVVIGMSTDEDEEDTAAVVKKMSLNYPVLKAREVAEQYEIDGFPTLLVIDPNGVIRKVHVGYSSELREELIAIVDELIKKE